MLKMKNEATDFVENKPDSKRPGKNEPKKWSPETLHSVR